MPNSRYVFHSQAGDVGGVVVVSEWLEKTLFAGSILSGRRGEIVRPSEWLTSELGSGCAPVPRITMKRVFDPSQIGAVDEWVAESALNTVLPSLWKTFGGEADEALVLLYARTIDVFDPARLTSYASFALALQSPVREWRRAPPLHLGIRLMSARA
ncbi:MAG: hypothetical protein QM756_45140 [Polyangiaceae bacterium]